VRRLLDIRPLIQDEEELLRLFERRRRRPSLLPAADDLP
jgi:hypothetical protein